MGQALDRGALVTPGVELVFSTTLVVFVAWLANRSYTRGAMKTTTITTSVPHSGQVGQVLEEAGGIFYDIVGVPDQFTMELAPFGFWRTVGWWLARRWDTVRGWFGRKPGAKTVDWDGPL